MDAETKQVLRGAAVVGGGTALIYGAFKLLGRKPKKKNGLPPPEPVARGSFVQWKRAGYVGLITKGESDTDWLVELRPAAQGGVTQVALVEPSYAMSTKLVRDWTDGVAGKTPKAPESVGSFVVYGRTGGLHTVMVEATSNDTWRWVVALSSEVMQAPALGPEHGILDVKGIALWDILLDAGRFVAAGSSVPTFAEATAAADAAAKGVGA